VRDVVYVDTRTYDVGYSTIEQGWSPGGGPIAPEPVMAPDTALVGTVLEPDAKPPLNRMMRFLVIDRSTTYIDGVDVTYRRAGRLWTQRIGICFDYGSTGFGPSSTCSSAGRSRRRVQVRYRPVWWPPRRLCWRC